MTKSRIKRKWYMPNGWHTPRGMYRKLKEKEKEIDRKHLQEERDSFKEEREPFKIVYKNIDYENI